MARAEEIRRLAYLVWEQEGRPEGRAAEHWRKAEWIWFAQAGHTPTPDPWTGREAPSRSAGPRPRHRGPRPQE